MTRFRFRLQKVLELREQAERARAVAVVEAQDRATTLRDARDSIADARNAGQETMTRSSMSGTTAGALQQMQFLLSAMDTQLQVADSNIVTAESLVRHAQDELRAAFQARHALDTLKDKQADGHRAAATHADRVLMDELALTRFHTNTTSPTDSERSTNG